MSSLGDKLYDIVTNTEKAFYLLGELTQLSYSAFENSANIISNGSEETITLKFPIGQYSDNEPMVGENNYKKDDLIRRYSHLAGKELPLMAIYQLVTGIETMIADIVRAVIFAYPKKLTGKKSILLSEVLNCETIEGVYLVAVDTFLNELMYKSPKDFAESIKAVINCNLLEVPAYHRYIEVKATRDIHIHNRGVANEIYISKAATHSRVKVGDCLPINTEYFLHAYESCIQVVEFLREELHEQWPSLKYESIKKSKESDTNKSTD